MDRPPPDPGRPPGRLEAARARARAAAGRVGRSDQVAAAGRWAGDVARRAPGADRLPTGAQARATAERFVGGERADGRPGPVAGTLWLLLGLATVGTTFLSWVRIEVADRVATLPLDDRVPRSLINVLDRGWSAHELLGLGTVLAVLTGVALALGLAGQVTRRWYWWLLAALTQLVAVVLAAAGLLVTLLVRSLVERFLPEEWDPYAPQAHLANGGLVYLGVATVFGALTAVIAVRSRRARRRGPPPSPPPDARDPFRSP